MVIPSVSNGFNICQNCLPTLGGYSIYPHGNNIYQFYSVFEKISHLHITYLIESPYICNNLVRLPSLVCYGFPYAAKMFYGGVRYSGLSLGNPRVFMTYCQSLLVFYISTLGCMVCYGGVTPLVGTAISSWKVPPALVSTWCHALTSGSL